MASFWICGLIRYGASSSAAPAAFGSRPSFSVMWKWSSVPLCLDLILHTTLLPALKEFSHVREFIYSLNRLNSSCILCFCFWRRRCLSYTAARERGNCCCGCLELSFNWNCFGCCGWLRFFVLGADLSSLGHGPAQRAEMSSWWFCSSYYSALQKFFGSHLLWCSRRIAAVAACWFWPIEVRTLAPMHDC